MLVKRIVLYCMLVALVPVMCSCAAPTLVGSNAAAYSGGRLHAVASRDMTAVYQASQTALKALEIEITDNAKDVFTARVVGMGANGKRITINIKPGDGDLTNFSIKVGSYGDKLRSRRIYEEIQKALK